MSKRLAFGSPLRPPAHPFGRLRAARLRSMIRSMRRLVLVLALVAAFFVWSGMALAGAPIGMHHGVRVHHHPTYLLHPA